MSSWRGVRGLARLAAAVVVLGLAGYGLVRHVGELRAPRGGAGPAVREEGSPAVEGLRAAVKGANVVVCVLDAARADHFTCYGYPRDTTPNTDRLAEEGFVFEKHFVQFPETKPSTASLFTSLYPDMHLAYKERMLPEGTFTLAQGFREAGFHTVLFSQNEYASPLWGLGLNFDEAYYEPDLVAAGRQRPLVWQPEALLEQIEPWLERGPRKPFFMYVHFMPPHDPYITPLEMYYRYYEKEPPEAWRSAYLFDELEPAVRKREKPWSQQMYLNRYDSHLLYGDWAVGELERLLREAGVLEDTLFIMTADHGEAFGEHGYKGHTISAYDETIHVPMVMRFPGPEGPKGRVLSLTQSIDVLPTLFELLEIEYPREEVDGHSLVGLMAGEVEKVNGYIYARTAGDPPSYVVRDEHSMLMMYRGGRLKALYDLEEDPRAVESVFAERPERAGELMEVFRAFAKEQVAPPLDYMDPEAPAPELPEVGKVDVTEEMEKTLRALGYLR